jgi:hypothetical protein
MSANAFSTRFQLGPAGMPKLWWKVQVVAACPDCGQEAVVGGLHGGGTFLSCPHCKYRGAFTASTFNEVIAALMTHVASKHRNL